MQRLALVLVLLSGCALYWGDDDDDVCKQGGFTEPLFPQELLRDPATGQCSSFGGGVDCDWACGPCPDLGIAQPDWATCNGKCEALGESACLSEPGCRVAYDLDNTKADSPARFIGCWGTAPSGIVHGQCTNLDAYGCSQHDDCAAMFLTDYDTTGPELGAPTTTYSSCIAEPKTAGCAGVTCAPGYHCESSECVADNPPAACSTLGTEATCKARNDCRPVYDGENCTCIPGDCQCEILTYSHCESKP